MYKHWPYSPAQQFRSRIVSYAFCLLSNKGIAAIPLPYAWMWASLTDVLLERQQYDSLDLDYSYISCCPDPKSLGSSWHDVSPQGPSPSVYYCSYEKENIFDKTPLFLIISQVHHADNTFIFHDHANNVIIPAYIPHQVTGHALRLQFTQIR